LQEGQKYAANIIKPANGKQAILEEIYQTLLTNKKQVNLG
jgi:hypothetical protein